MIQRSVCLCDGKYIGIESIYTVIDGKQINIPKKLEALRKKGRNNELFCPCGCGANLTVVASERGLRAQHFRIKDGTEKVECRATEEGEESLYSKIVLKCWLDDKLQVDDIETRVPISMHSDSDRKYEFSFVSFSRNVALSYTYDRYNLSEEKCRILRENRGALNLVCITDYSHRNPTGQYPETLMRMQEQQGYCSFLKQVGGKYKEALLSIVVYRKDCDGVWQEIQVAYALLHEFSFSADGELQYEDTLVSQMVMVAIAAFDERMQAELSRREAERLEQGQEGLQVVRHMREIVDLFAEATNMNFSLLASSGEGISGVLPKKTGRLYPTGTILQDLTYYTNSFHLPVYVNISAFEKIELEAPFHELCNGGHISYVELAEAPMANGEAIEDLVEYACENNIGYFGINYPLDECPCGYSGTFTVCPKCCRGGKDIKRLRRVSGYLSEENNMSFGKREELKHRRPNCGQVDYKGE